MKRTALLALALGAAILLPGCGFDIGDESMEATLIVATPTPTPTPTPEVTPTPEATPTPEPEPEPVYETGTTPSGIVVTKIDATYTALDAVNLRNDASTEGTDVMASAAAGDTLVSTGITENGWVEILMDGYTYYAREDFVQKVDGGEAPAAAAEDESTMPETEEAVG